MACVVGYDFLVMNNEVGKLAIALFRSVVLWIDWIVRYNFPPLQSAKIKLNLSIWLVVG